MTNPNEFLTDQELEDNSNFPVLTDSQKLNQLFTDLQILRKKYDYNVYSYDVEMKSIEIIFELAKRVQAQKAKTYKGSWKKRGWVVSIFGNISRKFDRLEGIFTDPSKALEFEKAQRPSQNEESVLDTFIDAGVYNFLAATKIMMEKSEIFDDWVQRNGLK